MALVYGLVKCKVASAARLQRSRSGGEEELHLLVDLDVPSGGGTQTWQAAINVGSLDMSDLLQYRVVTDFQHPIRDTLAGLPGGFQDLTGQRALPALDFLRSDILANTGSWQETDPMGGSSQAEPIPTLTSLLEDAFQRGTDTYFFGHKYTTGLGLHDIHMNQGSTGSLLNDPRDANKDHNEIWQDGAVLFDLGASMWTGYFTAFARQLVPTDDLGNPVANPHPIGDADPGSLIGQ